MVNKREKLHRSSERIPDFLIIGTQKGGTTSLYHYLIQHPKILPASNKELHFFDLTENYEKGLAWYKQQFPLITPFNRKKITGEATPNYLFHLDAPLRIKQNLPKTTKLIVLLRNPIDRAFSNYQMKVRKGHENRSFEEAIIHDEPLLRPQFEHLHVKDLDNKSEHRVFPYITRGLYINQLKTWMDLFPSNQFFIIKSEDLFVNPKKITKQVVRFLGLDAKELKIKNLKVINRGKYADKIDPKTRNILANYYRPYNLLLEEFLNRKFNWD